MSWKEQSKQGKKMEITCSVDTYDKIKDDLNKFAYPGHNMLVYDVTYNKGQTNGEEKRKKIELLLDGEYDLSDLMSVLNEYKHKQTKAKLMVFDMTFASFPPTD